MEINRISESELLETFKDLTRLPFEDYKNFLFPKNVTSIYILPILRNNNINGIYFTIEPANCYYFNSSCDENENKYDIISKIIIEHIGNLDFLKKVKDI